MAEMTYRLKDEINTESLLKFGLPDNVAQYAIEHRAELDIERVSDKIFYVHCPPLEPIDRALTWAVPARFVEEYLGEDVADDLTPWHQT